jgi:hypothetical protein
LAGVSNIDGLDPFDYHARQRLVELEKALIDLEDLDLSLAARLQQFLDDARSKGGPSGA